MNRYGSDLLPTRRSLLSRLKSLDDQESWRDFFETYWKLVYNAARKAGLTEAEAEDAVQETILTVTKKIGALKYDPALGSFKGWLLHIARWRIADEFRRRLPVRPWPEHRVDGSAPSTSTVEGLPDDFDLDALWEEDWHKNLLDAALRRTRRQVSARQYQLFDLYVMKDLPATTVARKLGVSLAQVYLAKHRITALVRREIRRLEKEFV